MADNEVAVLNTAMLDRGSNFTKEFSVMDWIHKIKIYNANPFSFDPKEKEVQEDLVWKFRLVEGNTLEIKYIDSNIKVNILSVCKVKSGNVFVLDDFWDPIKDEKWKSKKAFFYTNEHSLYTKKTDMLWFKQAWQKPLGFFVKSELEEMFRTKKINWKDNPFWKQWTKMDWEPYNDTHISDTIIIYGKFLEWKYAWEYFKFVPVSSSWYWITYKNGQQIDPVEWTFLDAMNNWLKEWNKIRTYNNKSPVKTVDPSQLDMTIWFKEIEVKGKRMFIPTFKFDMLTAYREDNTNDLNYILELQSQYLEEEFNTKVIVSNYRLWSINNNVAVSDISWIEVKAIENKSEEINEIEEITEEDVVAVFPSWVETRNWKNFVDWVEVPF